ncbi:MAG: hypothetical protein M0006_00855 [Magnetospirillum sp.]|nr:hypothetical protein [Magnetospirillum sp.]
MTGVLRFTVAGLLVAGLGVAHGRADELSFTPQRDGRPVPIKTLLATVHADNAEAEYLLGISELSRRDHPNPVKAAIWLRKAAMAGHRAAKVTLAGLYLRGIGVAADPHRAAALLKGPASGGDPQAQATLGELYRDGLGVRRNARAAARWTRLAAYNGAPRAALDLGLLLAQSGNAVRAAKWLTVAAARGDGAVKRQADGKIAELSAQGADAVVAEGMRLARDWMAGHPSRPSAYGVGQPMGTEVGDGTSALGENARLDRR